MKTFIATYLLDKEGDLTKKTNKPMVERIQDTIEYVFDKANDYERIKEKYQGSRKARQKADGTGDEAT